MRSSSCFQKKTSNLLVLFNPFSFNKFAPSKVANLLIKERPDQLPRRQNQKALVPTRILQNICCGIC